MNAYLVIALLFLYAGANLLAIALVSCIAPIVRSRILGVLMIFLGIWVGLDTPRVTRVELMQVDTVRASSYGSQFKLEGLPYQFYVNTDLQAGCLISGDILWQLKRSSVGINGSPLRGALDLWRASLVEGFVTHCQHLGTQSKAVSGHYPFLKALSFGRLDELNTQQLNALTNSNLIHLFVVSGLHLGVLVFGMYRSLARYVGVVACVMTVSLFGLWFLLQIPDGPSVRRVLVGLILVGAVALMRANISYISLLMMNAFVVICTTPDYFGRLGLWMSYGAVLLILLTVDGRRGVPFYSAFGLQYKLTAQSTSVLMGRADSFVNLGANTILVPLWTIVVPLALFISILNIPWLSQLAEAGLAALVDAFSSVNLSFYPGRSFWLMGLICLFISTRARLPFKLSMILGLCLLYSSPHRQNVVDVLDVGQGSSLLLSSNETHLVIDTGFGDQNFSMIQSGVRPAMIERGVSQLDILLSHRDLDHSGGYEHLAALMDVTPRIAANKLDCVQGQRWQYGAFAVEVLWPPIRSNNQHGNRDSCVFLINNASKSMLLMGDGDIDEELRMLRHYPDLKADYLILGHHGSATSTSWALLATLKPSLALISAGAHQRFGHPSERVLAKLSHFGIKTLVTHDVGTITLQLERSSEDVFLGCANSIITTSCIK